MMNTGMKAAVPAIAAAVLLLGACGSDDDGTAGAAELASTAQDAEPAATTTPPTTTSPTTTSPTTEPSAPAVTDAPAEAPVFTTQDAIDVVYALGRAYNTYDTELFMAVAAEDFQFVDERGTADRATQASYFPALREGGQQGKRTGDVVVISEDPFVIAEDAHVTANWYPPEGRMGTSTYKFVVENGELKVQEHRWTGDLL